MSFWSRLTDPSHYYRVERFVHEGLGKKVKRICDEISCAPHSTAYKVMDGFGKIVTTPFLAAGTAAVHAGSYACDLGDSIYDTAKWAKDAVTGDGSGREPCIQPQWRYADAEVLGS